MFRVVFYKLFCAIPDGRNRLDIFEETEHKAVHLFVFGHVAEGIETDIAKKFDAWLYSPVPFVFQHQRLAKKESRLKPAHMSVTCRVTVNDFSFPHIFPNFPRLLLVYPVWERPVLLGDFSISSPPRYKRSGSLLEILVEFIIIEEDPIVMIVPVEPILDLSD